MAERYIVKVHGFSKKQRWKYIVWWQWRGQRNYIRTSSGITNYHSSWSDHSDTTNISWSQRTFCCNWNTRRLGQISAFNVFTSPNAELFLCVFTNPNADLFSKIYRVLTGFLSSLALTPKHTYDVWSLPVPWPVSPARAVWVTTHMKHGVLWEKPWCVSIIIIHQVYLRVLSLLVAWSKYIHRINTSKI